MTLSWLRASILSIALLVSVIAFAVRRADGISPLVPRPSPLEATPNFEASPYRQAATAIRERDYAAARAHLAPLTVRADAMGKRARLVLGLYAHAQEELVEAERLLRSEADPAGPLEDWRLFILADTSQALGKEAVAQEALGRLLAVHPRSPLRQDALLLAATLARDAQNLPLALELIESARRDGLTVGRSELEVLAWEIGGALEEPDVQEEAARRLLVEHPLEASKLQVIELFRQASGELDWPHLLTARQLKQRARRLLELGLHENSLNTLGFVTESERSFEWHLLQAQSLTGAHRGRGALEVLASVRPANDRQRARLAWQRALAALDMATARRGRTNLPSAEREEMRQQALRQLRSVVENGSYRQTSLRALRLLFAELADSDRFDEAMQALETLRRLEPSDLTGARFLWRKGWSQYGDRNYSGAIGYWSRLEQLYPESSFARSGRYWSARAHEHLGNRERAATIYREITAVETTDFYRRHALVRLGEDPTPVQGPPLQPIEPWPEDPRLDRALLLSELGLDDLALTELAGLKNRSDSRAYHALQALILARQGKRRDSIRAVREVFPNLGGPYQSSVPERALYLYYPLDYHGLVDKYARRQNLSSHLVLGMIRQESAFDPTARSWAGARGLMQLMPATGRELARRIGLRYSTRRLTDPEFSIRLGTTYFRQVLELFDGNEELALAGYNGGPYRIKRLWRLAGSNQELDRFLEGLHLEETTTYVKRVVLFADSYRQLYRQVG